MSLAEMRAELRELRKSHPDHAPVSKMRKADVSDMIQRLKVHRAETPNVTAFSSAPAKMYKAASETVEKAKESEFPLAHVAAPKAAKAAKAPKTPKPTMKVEAAKKKGAMVSEKGDVAAKKPRGKKAEA
jgi:hypothetical protein